MGEAILNAPSDLSLGEDKEEAVDGEDDEDVPIELSTFFVTGVDKADSPTGYTRSLWEMKQKR